LKKTFKKNETDLVELKIRIPLHPIRKRGSEKEEAKEDSKMKH
jgi:hypothetical protein